MKEYNPSVIKEYNPSDSKEKPVYKIGRRGFLIAAGVTLAAGCGGKKETTPEQTSGQLPEHVESGDNTPSPEVSPTPEGPKTLEASEFQTMESLYKHFFDSRIPEGRKAFEALTIPANDYNDPQKLGQRYVMCSPTPTNKATHQCQNTMKYNPLIDWVSQQPNEVLLNWEMG